MKKKEIDKLSVALQRKKYYEKNKKRILQKQKEWAEKHRAFISNWHKEYYQKNKEKLDERRKRYYKENPQRKIEKNRKYTERNPRSIWATRTICNHKIKFIVQFSHSELLDFMKKVKKCRYCGVELEYGKGRSLFGPSLDRIDNERELTLKNVQIICQRCNGTKQDRSHEEFVAYCQRVVDER